MLGNRSGDLGISIWVSDDLVAWSKRRDFFPDISKTPNFKPAQPYHGAPKIFCDSASAQYLITWHSSCEEPVEDQPERFWSGMRTLYVTSKDLADFSDPCAANTSIAVLTHAKYAAIYLARKAA